MQAAATTKKPEEVKALPSYIIASVEPTALKGVVEELRKEQGVSLITPTSGRLNLVVQFSSNEPAKVYAFVGKVRSLKGVKKTRTLMPFEGHVMGGKPMPDEVVALSFLGVREQTGKVLEQLKQAPVRSAYVVPGEFDIVATVSGKDHNEVLERVTKMAEIPGVERSETMFAYKPVWA